MKYQKEKIILFISISCSIFLSTYLWNYISFIYSDPGIIGIYSKNNHDAKNDIFRYFLFVGLPVLVYFFLKYFFKKDFFLKIKTFLTKKDFISLKTHNSLLFLLFIFIILLLLEFLSLKFPDHKIDSYHDGQKLSSAYKSYLDGSLWSGSYVTVGIFYETLASKFIWQLFDHISIGLFRFTTIFFILIFKFSLVFLSFLLTKFLYLDNFYKKIFFLFNSVIFLSLTEYNSPDMSISFRDLPVVILFNLFICLFFKKNQTLVLFLISSLSILSMLWGIDRGLICNLLIIIIFLHLFCLGDYKKFFTLLLFISFFWVLFYFMLGNEFSYFINNTVSVYKEMSYVHGLIHPTPFSDEPDAGRATKTIISIIICLLISLSLIFKSNTKFSTSFKNVMFFLAIMAFGSYLYALGRSDGQHIKHSFGFPIMFLSIYFSYLLIFKISKIGFKTNKFAKNISIFIILGIFVAYMINLNSKDIFTYKKRFNSFINLSDDHFLNKEELVFIKKINTLVKDYNCIQLFTNDAAFNYLLRKKSCTKFYFVYVASPLDKQKKFISELDNTKIIIANGPKNNWDIRLEDKLFLVDNFIQNNFYKHESIKYWDVFLNKY